MTYRPDDAFETLGAMLAAVGAVACGVGAGALLMWALAACTPVGKLVCEGPDRYYKDGACYIREHHRSSIITIMVTTELVRTGNGVEAVPVPLRLRPWQDKVNPLWWFGNDEMSAQGNTFYYKYVRNFAQNFRWYVIGIADRPHIVTGLYGYVDNPIPAKRSDIRPVESGLQYSVNYIFGLPLLPWVSVSYRYLTAYIGWEPDGGFGVMLNLSNGDIENKHAVDEDYFNRHPERRRG